MYPRDILVSVKSISKIIGCYEKGAVREQEREVKNIIESIFERAIRIDTF